MTKYFDNQGNEIRTGLYKDRRGNTFLVNAEGKIPHISSKDNSAFYPAPGFFRNLTPTLRKEEIPEGDIRTIERLAR